MTDIPTPDGRMDAFVCHPEQGGPFPSVFILMDIWGLREELFDIARKIAVTGYQSDRSFHVGHGHLVAEQRHLPAHRLIGFVRDLLERQHAIFRVAEFEPHAALPVPEVRHHAVPPVRQALLEAFGANPNVQYHPVLHQAADHGYALPDRNIYAKQAANRDWEAIFAMFSRNLGASRKSHAAA